MHLITRRDRNSRLRRRYAARRLTAYTSSNAVDRMICYLNTDLDIATSAGELTGLAAAFDAKGVFSLHVTRGEDGIWLATFETKEQHLEPEPNIAAMVAVVESLANTERAIWSSCTLREFNIGYDCGTEPWAFNQGLSSRLLKRMVAVGASLRVTLYPGREATRHHAQRASGA